MVGIFWNYASQNRFLDIIMNKLIELNSVELTYPVYSVKAQSLRNALANLSVGGRLLKSGSDILYIQALIGLTFSVDVGDRVGIIGHNGAGKTTLLKLIAGIYEPTSGRIAVNGKISSMIDFTMGFDANMTGRENIVHIGRMRGLSTKFIQSKMDEIIEFSELGTFIDMPVKIFSSGMQSRLIFSVVTTLDPDIMLLDEWLSAGDADFVTKAQARINQLLDKSRCLILASHSFELIKSVCNKLLVLDGGKQAYYGPIEGWNFETRSQR